MDCSKQLYNCKLCNFTTFNSKDYKRHELSKKHETNTKQHKLSMFKYACMGCDYRTDLIANYTRHMKSQKHLNVGNSKIVCVCGSTYKYSQGLSRHKKTCKEYLQLTKSEKKHNHVKKKQQSNWCDDGSCDDSDDDSETSESLPPNTVSKQKYLALATKFITAENKIEAAENKIEAAENKASETMKQNIMLIDVVAEQQKKLNDIIPKIGNTTNNNVNINVFLNEKCKDAVNLMDFINSIQLQMSDLEGTTDIGFVGTISNLLIDGLNQMNVTDRPIHCTDGKRDVIYVKDNDAWEKDGVGHPKIKRAIKRINRRNSCQLTKWMDDNPECNDPESHKSAKYMSILSSIVPDDEDMKVKKIIKNVAKSVILDRVTCMNNDV
jgi:hypothetical protein